MIEKTPATHEFDVTGVFLRGKSSDPAACEDHVLYDNQALVLADGATDQSGVRYENGRSGGANLARLACELSLRSRQDGYALADEITAGVREFYAKHNTAALDDGAKRAATTLLVARLHENELRLTQIGDSNIRLTFHDQTTRILSNDKEIDDENADRRAQYIEEALASYAQKHGHKPTDNDLEAIVKAAREQISSRLKNQYQLQNNVDEALGYGIINGQTIPAFRDDGTPTDFVKTYTVNADSLASIELASDGFYGAFAESATVDGYDHLYEEIHRADPHKYKAYRSTKSLDDASVIIARVV